MTKTPRIMVSDDRGFILGWQAEYSDRNVFTKAYKNYADQWVLEIYD